MSEARYVGGMVTAFSAFLFAIWLLVTFWTFFAWAGGVALVLWLAWRAWPVVSWWLTFGRIQHRTGQAIERDRAAYEQASRRMDEIARHYRHRP